MAEEGKPIEQIKGAIETQTKRLVNSTTPGSSKPDAVHFTADLMQKVGVPKKYLSAHLSHFPENIRRAIQTARNDKRDGFYFHGPTGCGKTYLAAAVIAASIEDKGIVTKSGGFKWITAPGLLLEIRDTYHSKSDIRERAVVDKYTNPAVLVLDDLGSEKMTDWSLSAMYLIIAKRIDMCRITIVTSNLSLSQLHEYEPRLASRFGAFACIKPGTTDRRIS